MSGIASTASFTPLLRRRRLYLVLPQVSAIAPVDALFEQHDGALLICIRVVSYEDGVEAHRRC